MPSGARNPHTPRARLPQRQNRNPYQPRARLPQRQNRNPHTPRARLPQKGGEDSHGVTVLSARRYFINMGYSKTINRLGLQSLSYHRAPCLTTLKIHKYYKKPSPFLSIFYNYASATALNKASNSSRPIFSFSKSSSAHRCRTFSFWRISVLARE